MGTEIPLVDEAKIVFLISIKIALPGTDSVIVIVGSTIVVYNIRYGTKKGTCDSTTELSRGGCRGFL